MEKKFIVGRIEEVQEEKTLHVLAQDEGDFTIKFYSELILDCEDYSQKFTENELINLRDGITELLKKFGTNTKK